MAGEFLFCDRVFRSEVLAALPAFLTSYLSSYPIFSRVGHDSWFDAPRSSCRFARWTLSPCHDIPSVFRFFKDLEERHQENIVIDSISDIVFRHAQASFDPYITYCSNEVYQQRTLQRLV